MKAVRIHEHGGPEVVRCEDAPEPRMRANEVLIKVRACSINHLDLWVRGGIPGLKVEMPHILGSDASGEVVDTGELVENFNAGDRVLVSPGHAHPASESYAAGTDHYCGDYGLWGYHYPGVQSEYIAIPETDVLPIPGDLNFEQAAAAPLVFLTAWHMLVGIAKIRFGEEVLVIGGSSGVGSAAIQIAKLFHCRVIATAGGEEKLAKARALGADDVIDHYEQDVKNEVRRLTGKRGVDIVFEHVGAATWKQSVACLAHHGRLVTCGATTGADVGVNLAHLFARHLSLHGSFMGPKAELYEALRLIGRGLLKPVIDRTFPLAEARAAHEHLENKKQFGKVVLTV